MDTNNPGLVAGDTTVLPPPAYTPVRENEQVLLSLGITADHIAALPLIVQNGAAAFLVLEIRSEEVLPLLQPVSSVMHMLAVQYQLAGYCLFYRHQGSRDEVVALPYTLPLADEMPTADHAEVALTIATPALATAALACYLYDIAMIKKEVVHLHLIDQAAGAEDAVSARLHVQDGKIQGVSPMMNR
ncbi:hypothetical protein [Paraflavitalea pollutisoli]|uniref:hypothetical protein n=1 Tax=Paraflavitalea pollutisoli TaxID=3034143 RepID=UPI0023EBCBFF|nr:hypothetical protein [Paraflavitalea sp. H1-2-19X]